MSLLPFTILNSDLILLGPDQEWLYGLGLRSPLFIKASHSLVLKSTIIAQIPQVRVCGLSLILTSVRECPERQHPELKFIFLKIGLSEGNYFVYSPWLRKWCGSPFTIHGLVLLYMACRAGYFQPLNLSSLMFRIYKSFLLYIKKDHLQGKDV